MSMTLKYYFDKHKGNQLFTTDKIFSEFQKFTMHLSVKMSHFNK